MNHPKTMVCFANSRKTSGRSVVGKEWHEGVPGRWLRPVSARPGHELSEEDRRFADGRDPQVLDIVVVPCLKPQPLPHQGENQLIDPAHAWQHHGRLPWSALGAWLDTPATLWAGGGGSSYGFLNNRVAEGHQDGRSLYLIALDQMQVVVGPKSADVSRRCLRGDFAYAGVSFQLAITDPVLERRFLAEADGHYPIDQPVLCVSLEDLFQGYYYKSIAAVLDAARFE
ncbi:MAG: hypothetical protein COS34_08130 [Lysobacterales bacterium CG02_land_8_20_14_3_00_62_12]|nr:MAG: hypothetical protein COS34_08130 [Xanthomonadales bacterium CG02_land_8_20_14_3_00_62_12]PJA42350.1 MAG: hypothetical protein CO182_02965 [Xanthomonadales bacterium CG_4_9_14_3_um_filter_62_6]